MKNCPKRLVPCLDAGKRQLSSAVDAGEVIHLPCLLLLILVQGTQYSDSY